MLPLFAMLYETVKGVNVPVTGYVIMSVEARPQLRLLARSERNYAVLEILSGLEDILRHSQITPKIFIGSKAKNSLSSSGEAEVRVYDRERTFFYKQVEILSRDYVNSAKSEWLKSG